MPRARPYTRKELETLRRADLQNLFKLHKLKGGNQKTETLIDLLEDFFRSQGPSKNATASRSPVKAVRPALPISTPQVSIQPTGTGTEKSAVAVPAVRHLKPIPAQSGEVAPRPTTRQSPGKPARPATSASGAVGGEATRSRGDAGRMQRAKAVVSEVEMPKRSALNRSTASNTNDTLSRRVEALTTKVDHIESALTLIRLEDALKEIDHLKEEVSRLDGEISILRNGALGVSAEALEARIKEVDEGWLARAQATEAVWEERFRVLEARMAYASDSAGPAGDAPAAGPGTEPTVSGAVRDGLSSTALGKRRERDSDMPIGFPSAEVDLSSPSKRPRNDTAATASTASTRPSSRDHLMALARRSASPSKSPRTPSPGKSGTSGNASVFKTPDLPASAMKNLSSRPARTPSPGHQGVLPDYSATPSTSNADYFAGLPHLPGHDRGRSRSKSSDEPLPFPLFATTPRPAAPTSPTTDAPPSTIRRQRADSGFNSALMLTPGRRPSRTISHAHMELSSITDSPSAAASRTAPGAHVHAAATPAGAGEITQMPRAAELTTPIRLPRSDRDVPPAPPIQTLPKSTRKAPPVSSHRRIESFTFSQAPILALGPELSGEISDVPRLSPSPSITETRFSALPFPTNHKLASRSVSASTLGTATTLATDLESDTSREHISMRDVAVLGSSSPAGPAGPAGVTSKHHKQPETTNPAELLLASPTTPTAPTVADGQGLGLGFGLGSSLGLGMTTPGHRTMLGTEAYRDTRFGDQPLTMGWGTPEMPDTPRVGGAGQVSGGMRRKPPHFS